MLGREFSGVTYPQIGVPDAHHPITHHQQEPEKIAKVAKINAYHVTQFAYLLETLRSTPDGDGTLLDHVIMMYGTGMGDCNAHDPRNIPLLLAGGGAGHSRADVTSGIPRKRRLANLHLTLLDKMGIHIDRMGDTRPPRRSRARGDLVVRRPNSVRPLRCRGQEIAVKACLRGTLPVDTVH
jgi:hypothetical protein